MNPALAPERPALEKELAPSCSKVRKIKAEERPDPDLKARHLLASAAPASDAVSEEDPAEGNVKETVEVEDASSVTTMRPLGRVLMSVLDELELVGEVDGRL